MRKSKKTRKFVTEFFEFICPNNLTYPVQELKSLKKQIKSEENVKGNIDKQDILKYISKNPLIKLYKSYLPQLNSKYL